MPGKLPNRVVNHRSVVCVSTSDVYRSDMSPADALRSPFLAGFVVVSVATVAGFVVTSLVVAGVPGMEPLSQRPNVIIIDVDRMAADHMPCYGYGRNTTPVMCAFGERNTLFTDAVAQSGWTASSVASMFTGQYPGVHGLVGHQDTLGSDRATLAEILRRNGYRTAAFPANFDQSAAALTERYNLDQGFGMYTEGYRYIGQQLHRIGRWLGRTGEPFFMYVQGFGPHRYTWYGVHSGNGSFDPAYTGVLHDPDVIPRDVLPVTRIYRNESGTYVPALNGTPIALDSRDIEHVITHYDAELRQSDRDVAALFDLLRSQGVYSNSIIILTANHGEVLNASTYRMMGGRLFGHGGVWEGDIRVPLMVRFPGGGDGGVREDQVELIDVVPTVLRAVGIPIDGGVAERLQGEPVQGTPPGGEVAFSINLGGDQRAVRNTSWKLVAESGGWRGLYRIGSGAGPHRNVAESHPGIVKAMATSLEEHRIRNKLLRTSLYGEE